MYNYLISTNLVHRMPNGTSNLNNIPYREDVFAPRKKNSSNFFVELFSWSNILKGTFLIGFIFSILLLVFEINPKAYKTIITDIKEVSTQLTSKGNIK